MPTDEVHINLDGPRGGIDPRAVADAIAAADKIIRCVSDPEPPRLAITGLDIGSAHISIRCGERRATIVNTGLSSLARSATAPAGWGSESLNALIELSRITNRPGVEGIRLGIDDVITRIDDELAGNARASMDPPRQSLGSVRGKLYRYNNDTRRYAGLREYRTGKAVNVHFPPELGAQVKNALDFEVELWGMLRRNADDQIESITIEGIEVLDETRARITIDDVAGHFGPDWTGGVDPAEWVRRQRD